MCKGCEAMDGFERALGLLPEGLRTEAARYRARPVEEIRLRLGRRPSLLIGLEELELPLPETDAKTIGRVLERVTEASVHAASAALKEGYVSYRGIRVGVCGRALQSGGSLSGLRDFSSLNIRVPREFKGICDNVITRTYTGGFENTLIVSGPGGGKTTALREFIRRFSDRGLRIGVVDERNELSASDGAQAMMDLGGHSDILVGAPKAEGAMLLLRGMNPQLIAMDEISSPGDIDAVLRVFGCGVGLLASAHASGRDELTVRTEYRRLLRKGVFKRLLVIKRSGAGRLYEMERLE